MQKVHDERGGHGNNCHDRYFSLDLSLIICYNGIKDNNWMKGIKMDNSEKQFTLTREMYKKIKCMTREQMQVFLTTVYVDGMKSVDTVNIDLDKLREEIGAVKGVGESRLNEIMRIINEHAQTQGSDLY